MCQFILILTVTGEGGQPLRSRFFWRLLLLVRQICLEGGLQLWKSLFWSKYLPEIFVWQFLNNFKQAGCLNRARFTRARARRAASKSNSPERATWYKQRYQMKWWQRRNRRQRTGILLTNMKELQQQRFRNLIKGIDCLKKKTSWSSPSPSPPPPSLLTARVARDLLVKNNMDFDDHKRQIS